MLGWAAPRRLKPLGSGKLIAVVNRCATQRPVRYRESMRLPETNRPAEDLGWADVFSVRFRRAET